jgi:DNA-binding XRE family transcriptional regulator
MRVMSTKPARGKGSNRFSQRRIELGFTQDYVAKYVGIQVRTFQNWEAKGQPGPLVIPKMERLLELYRWTYEELRDACYPNLKRLSERSFRASDDDKGYKTKS